MTMASQLLIIASLKVAIDYSKLLSIAQEPKIRVTFIFIPLLRDEEYPADC
jgi:hypothetical protein